MVNVAPARHAASYATRTRVSVVTATPRYTYLKMPFFAISALGWSLPLPLASLLPTPGTVRGVSLPLPGRRIRLSHDTVIVRSTGQSCIPSGPAS